ncbi:hypothetical protein evm_015598, partial [Chilo suppressalis]
MQVSDPAPVSVLYTSARYTLHTHFSQYARLPRLSPHILNDNRSVGIAFDNMQITMGDLDLLPHMYAPLQLMFAEHCVEMELKAAHRARRKERRASSPHLSAGTVRSYSTDSKLETDSKLDTNFKVDTDSELVTDNITQQRHKRVKHAETKYEQQSIPQEVLLTTNESVQTEKITQNLEYAN